MKQIVKKVKFSQIPDLIKTININQETIVNLTIETVEDDILSVFQ